MKLLSLNIARPRAVPYTDHPEGVTGIDKRPVDGPVRVTAPGPKGVGASGLAGDAVCDLRHHGGNDQAVYAVAARTSTTGGASSAGRWRAARSVRT